MVMVLVTADVADFAAASAGDSADISEFALNVKLTNIDTLMSAEEPDSVLIILPRLCPPYAEEQSLL
jgi:hypothetical protein